jgi:tetratricopeptide (TPR) repeat protein
MVRGGLPLLAFHWNRAGNGESECRYAQLAGTQAAKQYANAEAKVYFSRALELIDKMDREGLSDRRFDTLRNRARVNALLGSVDEERSDLEVMSAIADRADEGPRKGDVQLLWSDFHKRGGRFSEALEQAEGALATFRESENVVGEAKSLTHVGSALEGQGQLREARERVEDALRLFRTLEDPEGEAASLKTLGIIGARLGEFPVAMKRFGEARDLYRGLEDKKGEADILGNLGAVNYYLGKYDETVAYTQQAQRLFEEMGNRVGSAKCLTNLGNAYNALGAFDRGLERHERALEIYKQLEDANGCADSHSNLGNSHHALGAGGHPELAFRIHGETKELRDAVACHGRALALRTEIGSRGGEAVSRFNLGSSELCIGNLDAAESYLRHALEAGAELGLSRLALRSLSALARTRLLAGDLEGAMERSREAIEQLGEQVLPEADELHFTHFKVLMANDREDEARRHLELAYQSVVRRAEAVRDEDLREDFLSAYREVLNAWRDSGEIASGG